MNFINLFQVLMPSPYLFAQQLLDSSLPLVSFACSQGFFPVFSLFIKTLVVEFRSMLSEM